jgi:hypothetical protein
MKNTWKTLAVVVPFALVAACTDAAKAPAEAAMAAAASAVDSLKGEATKWAPEAVKSVETTYGSAKDLIAKQDYKGALATAGEIPAKAKDALAKAAANKDVVVKAWNEAGGSLTKMMDAAKSRLDILAQSKKLPKGMDKATVAQAQADLSTLQSGWASAVEQFKSGDMSGAMAKASALKAKGLELLKTLGLQ